MPFINKTDIHKIITDPNSTKLLVERADAFGKHLASKEINLSTNQIRAIFGEVKRIQAQWDINQSKAFRQLILLQPKMAYRKRKERGRGVKELVAVLDPALEEVIDSSDQNRTPNFQRFVEFFEAILAYHRAYGGK